MARCGTSAEGGMTSLALVIGGKSHAPYRSHREMAYL